MINKDLNTNLQLTIKKDSFNNLLKIQKRLSKKFNFEFTKSQTIEFLINNFDDLNQEKEIIIKKDNLFKKLRILRNEILATNNQGLADYLNISLYDIEDYINGKKNATGENATKILNALKKNNIN